MSIPKEVKKFLEMRGVILLVRGVPGTGKTTFALSLMKDYNLAYLVPSKTIEEIGKEHPWIDEEMKEKMFSITEKYDYDETDRFGQSFYLLPEAFRHVLNLWERGEINGIIIDSWHAIINEMNIKAMEEKEREKIYDSTSLFLKILKLSDAGVKFVIVKEGETDDEISYLSDGVVTLHREIKESRVYRWLTIEKMRGIEIEINRYYFTLKDSKFQHLKSGRFEHPKFIKGFSASGGISVYFDDLLSINRSNVVVFDFGEYIPKSYKTTTVMGFVASSITRESRAIIVPPNELDMSELKYNIYVFGLERYFRNISYIYGQDTMEEFAIKVDFSDSNVLSKAIGDEISKVNSEHPPVVIIGYDRLYSYMDNRELMRTLYRISDIVKSNGGVLLITGNMSDKEIKRFCSSIADIYVKFHNVGGDIIMYGIKPWTPVYHLDIGYVDYPTISKKVIV